MVKFVLLLSFLIFTLSKEGHSENSPSQGSVRDRIKQLENLPNPIIINPSPQGQKHRPLPDPQKARSPNANTPQAESRKEIGGGEQKKPYSSPPTKAPTSISSHSSGWKSPA